MITPAQLKMLVFINDFTSLNGGLAPTYDEVLEGLGEASTSNVFRKAKALRERGMLTTPPKNSLRALQLTASARKLLGKNSPNIPIGLWFDYDPKDDQPFTYRGEAMS